MTDEVPECACHGVPMMRHKDPSRKAGWRWRCRVQSQEANRRWRETSPVQTAESNRRWREANPERKRSLNARRMYAGSLYVGSCGFSDSEIKEMIDGSSDRP